MFMSSRFLILKAFSLRHVAVINKGVTFDTFSYENSIEDTATLSTNFQ